MIDILKSYIQKVEGIIDGIQVVVVIGGKCFDGIFNLFESFHVKSTKTHIVFLVRPPTSHRESYPISHFDQKRAVQQHIQRMPQY